VSNLIYDMPVQLPYNNLIQQFHYYYMKGEYKTASSKLQTAIDGGERTGENYFNLGKSCYQDGDFQNAAKNYGIAAGYSPNEPIYWLYYGHALQKIGQDEEAKTVLTQASTLSNDLDELVRVYESIEQFRRKYSVYIDKEIS